jgi:oligosaccharide repeat unit polymerase
MLATLFFFATAFVLLTVLRLGGDQFTFARYFTLVSFVFVNLGFFLNHLLNGHAGTLGTDLGVAVTCLGLLSVVLGMLVGHGAANRSVGAFRKPIVRSYAMGREATPGTLLAVMSIVILVPTWLYFAGLGYVPLFDAAIAISSSGLDGLGVLNASRLSRDTYVNADASRVPLQGLLEIYRNLGVPVLFALALFQVRKGLPAFPRVFVIAVCVISVMAAGQRWPLMYLLAAALFVLASDNLTLSSRPVRLLMVTAAVAGVALSTLQSRSGERFESIVASVSNGFLDLLLRITVGQVEVPIASYSSSDPALRWQLGATYLKSLASYLPGSGASYPVEFYQKVTGDQIGYTAPPDLYTEAYINFSWLGVVVLGVAWGLALARFENLFRGKDAWNVAMRAGLLTVMLFSSTSGMVFTSSFVFVAIGCFLARWSANLLCRGRFSELRPRGAVVAD